MINRDFTWPEIGLPVLTLQIPVFTLQVLGVEREGVLAREVAEHGENLLPCQLWITWQGWIQ